MASELAGGRVARDDQPHRWQQSAELCRALEAKRFPGRWAAVKGLVEDNEAWLCGGSDKGIGLPSSPLPTEAVRVSAEAADIAPRFAVTEFCVANVDTLGAALVLGDDTAVLNFANPCVPGGRYRYPCIPKMRCTCLLYVFTTRVHNAS